MPASRCPSNVKIAYNMALMLLALNTYAIGAEGRSIRFKRIRTATDTSASSNEASHWVREPFEHEEKALFVHGVTHGGAAHGVGDLVGVIPRSESDTRTLFENRRQNVNM